MSNTGWASGGQKYHAMEPLMTRPNRRGHSIPWDESKHKRDWHGKFTKMYNKAIKPTKVRGPRRLVPESPHINRLQGRHRVDTSYIPWNRRRLLGKVWGLMNGDWKKWRRRELRRRARQESRERGFR